MSETVEHNMFKPYNLIITWTKSGKLDKQKVELFYAKVLPRSVAKIFFCCKIRELHQQVMYQSTNSEESFANKKVQLITLPPKTTGLIQPPDLLFFRPYKAFLRRISDIIVLEMIDFRISNRNNLLKLQSFIFNQFRGDRFKNMIKHSFYMAGYLFSKPRSYVDSVQFCFEFVPIECSKQECTNDAILKCAKCELHFCFIHLLVEVFHYHTL